MLPLDPVRGQALGGEVGQATPAALAEHRKAMLAAGFYGPDRPVFCDTAGGYLRISNLRKNSFKPVLVRAGLPDIRLHDLRHTCATLLLLADQPAKVVSERLGHSSPWTPASTCCRRCGGGRPTSWDASSARASRRRPSDREWLQIGYKARVGGCGWPSKSCIDKNFRAHSSTAERGTHNPRRAISVIVRQCPMRPFSWDF